MLHNVQFSLIEHLKNSGLFNSVVWLYTGVSLKDEQTPYATVKSLVTGVQGLDKLQEYEASTYNLEVGVFCDSEGDLLKLQEKAKKVMMREPIKLFDTDGVEPVEIGTFRVNVQNITPITDGDVSQRNGKHRSYIDLTVLSLNKLK